MNGSVYCSRGLFAKTRWLFLFADRMIAHSVAPCLSAEDFRRNTRSWMSRLCIRRPSCNRASGSHRRIRERGKSHARDRNHVPGVEDCAGQPVSDVRGSDATPPSIRMFSIRLPYPMVIVPPSAGVSIAPQPADLTSAGTASARSWHQPSQTPAVPDTPASRLTSAQGASTGDFAPDLVQFL